MIRRGGIGQVAGHAGMDEGESEIIECRPTKWFYLRAAAMVAMFAIFTVLFFKDWKIGWPRKNEAYYSFQAFQEAKLKFPEYEGDPDGWRQFVASQKIGFPKEEGVLPAGVDPEAGWPEILADYEVYRKAREEETTTVPPLWTRYSGERGWSSGAPEKSYNKQKIDGQLYMGIGSGALTLVGVFFLVRTSRRTMKVDGEAYYAPGGERVAFRDIRRIDKRKWETKGLAYLYHGDSEAPAKAKVDGMVYGQFKEEDGAPAERLFQRILLNFSGELVDLESEDEEEGEDAPAGSGRKRPPKTAGSDGEER